LALIGTLLLPTLMNGNARADGLLHIPFQLGAKTEQRFPRRAQLSMLSSENGSTSAAGTDPGFLVPSDP
jgi:hypothetical protein